MLQDKTFFITYLISLTIRSNIVNFRYLTALKLMLNPYLTTIDVFSVVLP